MRIDSLTFGCPMNSASRCGRSESSTTDSSERTSGVVISARVIYQIYPEAGGKREVFRLSDSRRKLREPLCRPLQCLLLFAERKPRHGLAELWIVIEARSGDCRDADIL